MLAFSGERSALSPQSLLENLDIPLDVYFYAEFDKFMVFYFSNE